MLLKCPVPPKFDMVPTAFLSWTCNKSISPQQREKNKKRERLVLLGMLINIHELLSLASIFKMTGSLSTVSSKLEWAIVKEHRAEPRSVVSLSFLSI